MRSVTRFMYVVFAFALFECLFLSPVGGQTGPSKAATIKKKNGQIIKGEINGIVVQGGSELVTGSPGGYGALYYTPKGEQIESIDEDGVHYRPGARIRYVSIGQKDKIDDSEAAGVAIEMENNFTAMFDYSGKHGMASVKSDTMSLDNPAKFKLLGEYRKEGSTGKIIPALEVNTAKGIVLVPIAEIVEFKKAADKPKF